MPPLRRAASAQQYLPQVGRSPAYPQAVPAVYLSISSSVPRGS